MEQKSIGIVSSGIYYQWYLPEIKPLDETVTEVNGTQFDVGYYIDAIEYQLGGQSSEYASYFLDIVLQSIQRDELVRQKAFAMGITVGEQEIDDIISQNDLPGNQAARDIVRGQLRIQKIN